MKKLFILAGLAAMFGFGSPVAAEKIQVDLELVLAVDVSDSIEDDEKLLQRMGYIEAITSPEVMQAIRGGLLGRIAVTYIEWAAPQYQHVVVPWSVIDNAQSADSFAARLSEIFGTQIPAFDTSISAGLAFAAVKIEGNEFDGIRRVIDVSGDGPNISGLPLQMVREKIISRGITINGLPLMLTPEIGSPTPKEALERYYRDCVIGGPGAFLIPVTNRSQIAEAIRQKLVLEIADRSPPFLQYAANSADVQKSCVGK